MFTPDLFTPALSEAVWVKSSHSFNNGDCVEIARGTAWTALRDSKNPDGPALVVPPATMRALVHAVKH